jgi:hypothetical protein
MLAISVSQLDLIVRRGVLSRAQISTRRHLLHVDELRTLADQGELAVRELRLRKKRLNPSA